jgi:hypothetical protein
MIDNRYQLVWTDGNLFNSRRAFKRTFFLIEIWLDSEFKLESWEEPHDSDAFVSLESDPESIADDLLFRLASACAFKPVAYTDLRAGMTFERTENRMLRNGGFCVETIQAAMYRFFGDSK